MGRATAIAATGHHEPVRDAGTERHGRASGGWVVLAGLATLDAVLTLALVMWCLDGISNSGVDPLLVTLPFLPLLAWLVAYAVAGKDWPQHPVRAIAATVTSTGAALGSLIIRALVSGGM